MKKSTTEPQSSQSTASVVFPLEGPLLGVLRVSVVKRVL